MNVLTTCLKEAGADLTKLPAFFKELEDAMGRYSGMEGAQKAVTSKEKRDRYLKAIQNDVERLLSRLSPSGENYHAGIRHELQQHCPALDEITMALYGVQDVISDLTAAKGGRGRRQKTPELWLALDVGQAMRDVLGIQPSTTETGLFVTLLRQLLPIEESRARKLAREAVRAIKST